MSLFLISFSYWQFIEGNSSLFQQCNCKFNQNHFISIKNESKTEVCQAKFWLKKKKLLTKSVEIIFFLESWRTFLYLSTIVGKLRHIPWRRVVMSSNRNSSTFVHTENDPIYRIQIKKEIFWEAIFNKLHFFIS